MFAVIESALAAFVFFAAVEARSAAISGIVLRMPQAAAGTGLRLQTATGPLSLSGATETVEADLGKLRTGDFLTGDGLVEGSGAILRSIDEVGLQALLGVWEVNAQELNPDIFEFIDFDRLNLYHLPSALRKDRSFDQWSYAVAPDVGRKWSLFVSGGGRVRVGSLEFSHESDLPSQVTIQYWQSGARLRPIVLSRFARPH